ncbi:hypothetical protein FKP32DRAFT_1587406 [Trametes sanguinea]|nr:hypothetical protein FKP32DRAFT_1587406 [Trametes sanguinea]
MVVRTVRAELQAKPRNAYGLGGLDIVLGTAIDSKPAVTGVVSVLDGEENVGEGRWLT